MWVNLCAFLKELRARRPLLVACIAAAAAMLFAGGFLSQREAELLHVAEPTNVVVAARDVAAGEALDEGNVAAAAVPRRYRAPGAIAAPADAAGRVAMVPIRAGTQLTAGLARRTSEAMGLAVLIPAGRRAISVQIPGTSGVAGLLRPNDAVDVLATFDLGSEAAARRTTLAVVEAAQVLAVDRRLAGAPEEARGSAAKGGLLGGALPARPAGDAVAVTLAVTPAEAQALAFAQESGALAVALRPFGDEEGGARAAPTTIATIAGGNEELLPIRKGFREYRGRK